MLRRIAWVVIVVVLTGATGSAHAGIAARRPGTTASTRARAPRGLTRPPRPAVAAQTRAKLEARLAARPAWLARTAAPRPRFVARPRPARRNLVTAPKGVPRRAHAAPRTGAARTFLVQARDQAWTGLKAIGGAMGLVTRYLGAHVTVATDMVEARLPARWHRAFRTLRLLNPGHFLAFATDRALKDPLFLLTYNVASYAVSKAGGLVLVGMGVSALTSFFAGFATLPIDITVLLMRERHLRRKTQPELTLAQTARDVLLEFRQFAIHRRARGRAMLGRPGYPFGTAPLASAY